MPCLTTLAHSCSAVVLPIWTMSSPKEVQKQSHSCSCQGCKATNHTETLLNLAKHWNSPEPSGTFRKLPPEPTPAHTGTLRNLPEPSGTFRNLPPEPAPQTRTGIHRSLSGLKTPLAYAVGEKEEWIWNMKIRIHVKSFLRSIVVHKSGYLGQAGHQS